MSSSDNERVARSVLPIEEATRLRGRVKDEQWMPSMLDYLHHNGLDGDAKGVLNDSGYCRSYVYVSFAHKACDIPITNSDQESCL